MIVALVMRVRGRLFDISSEVVTYSYGSQQIANGTTGGPTFDRTGSNIWVVFQVVRL